MYKLLPSEHDDLLFFRLDGEAAERHGSIGYIRADFGSNGREFWTTWFDNQPHLKTSAFKAELDAVINSLRDDGQEPPFASRNNLKGYCAAKPGKKLTTRGDGYVVQTLDFSYYFRCLPRSGDYDMYCFTFDNRWLLPELAGKHELPDFCYSILPSSGELIKIKRFESGYFQTEYNDKPELYRKTANIWNATIGVTKAQEEAMLSGSLFGWSVPAAKPWNYDQNGKPRPPQPKKDTPER